MKNVPPQANVATLTPSGLLQALRVLSARESARQSRLSPITRLGRGNGQ